MRNILRRLKRLLLTKGYARPVFTFVQHLERDNVQPGRQGDFVVNMSFDLELALNTYFWQGNYERALTYGRRAEKNLVPSLSYLQREGIPCNVQVVGMLLDTHNAQLPILSKEHVHQIAQNESLFQLRPDAIASLRAPSIEVGIHGFSHRLFSNFSEEEADHELTHAVGHVREQIYQGENTKLFMSFPRNNVAHTHLLKKHNVYAWRSNTQTWDAEGGIPLGMWFAPGTLGPSDLARLLHHIRKTQSSFFLHVWNHFTEMDTETLKTLVDVMRKEGWRFSTVRSYLQ